MHKDNDELRFILKDQKKISPWFHFIHMNHFMFVIVCIACIRQAISIGSSFYVSVTSFKLNKSNFFTDFVHFAFAIHKIQMVFTISFMFCDLPHLPFDIFPCIFAIKQKQNYSNVSIASWSAYDIKFVHFSWIEFIHLTSRPLQNSSSQSTDYFFSFTFFSLRLLERFCSSSTGYLNDMSAGNTSIAIGDYGADIFK